jgi:hypothetical protein
MVTCTQLCRKEESHRNIKTVTIVDVETSEVNLPNTLIENYRKLC